ncbi:hypothetical protein [Flammeovirga kamogawensis]|uniref:Uncharacterized protein n=1 Tax=Flammeovirga kamogawensis TaxID=373891 RepID=A0ABX8H0M5_9BACT|nr:hypothetical protein [Flammeovirga kamogawensis]MBB6462326.1 hypothetical protein [Flammeovirga kamogawensis]QWG09444.1 hypothetical protein KM029_22820 [Flammeovirga kamogawensis]TRX64959.1 hypothetical protein EO216_20720 [Flammeovirga kamogawensis]
MKKIILVLSLFTFSILSVNAQLVLVVQAVASSIKTPNQLDNVTFYTNGDSVVVSVAKLKKEKVTHFDSVKVQTLYSAQRVAKVYGDSIQVSDVPENALYYEHTKKYRNARMSTMFAVSGWTLVLLNPYFLIVAPLPTIQAITRDKSVDKAYVMNGKEWRAFKKEYKAYRKSFKGKKEKSNEENVGYAKL